MVIFVMDIPRLSKDAPRAGFKSKLLQNKFGIHNVWHSGYHGILLMTKELELHIKYIDVTCEFFLFRCLRGYLCESKLQIEGPYYFFTGSLFSLFKL